MFDWLLFTVIIHDLCYHHSYKKKLTSQALSTNTKRNVLLKGWAQRHVFFGYSFYKRQKIDWRLLHFSTGSQRFFPRVANSSQRQILRKLQTYISLAVNVLTYMEKYFYKLKNCNFISTEHLPQEDSRKLLFFFTLYLVEENE